MNNKDIAEQILRQAKGQQSDDIVTHSIIVNGEKIEVMTRVRRVVWRADPMNPGALMPYTESETIYHLGDDGSPLGGDAKKIGACAFGHAVAGKLIIKCRHCRSNICLKHAITAGKRAYCRRGICLVIGVVYKISYIIYRVIRFCVTSVIGGGEDKPPDTDYFTKG